MAVTQPPLTELQFLQLYPWPEELKKYGEPLRAFWFCDLASPVERLWPYLSDSSALNRLAGLGDMKLVEKEGYTYGTSVNIGVTLAWREEPWQWEYGKSIIIDRRYSQGFLKINRAVHLFEKLTDNRTRFYVQIGMVPSGLLGRLLVGAGLKATKEKFLSGARLIDQHAQKQQRLIFSAKRLVLSPTAEKRIQEIRKNLIAADFPANLVDKTIHYVRTAPDEELDRLRPKKIARDWHVNEKALLSVFLKGTRLGLFKMTWDVICPHCRGVREAADRLVKVPKRGHCEACQADFDANTFNALEVVFHIHPSIRQVEKKVYCSAEPAAKAHIKMQKKLEPGRELALTSLLGKGRYRLRLGGKSHYNLLDVDAEATQQEIRWSETLADQNLKTAYFPTIVLENRSAQPQLYILEDNQQDQDALRPADIFTFQNFRDLFNAECVASDVKLEVGVQTILFTDLVGSTQFYEKEGDAAAFAEVQKHFQKTYEAMLKHDGAIVKTIGDAVMAAFIKPVDALKAAVEMQEYFNGHNPDSQLRLRITLHTGSCLAVNLNDRLDYFGNTVNLTAKIQAVVGAGQVGFTQAVNDDPESAEFIRQKQLFVEDVPFEQKWSKSTMTVHRVGVS